MQKHSQALKNNSVITVENDIIDFFQDGSMNKQLGEPDRKFYLRFRLIKLLVRQCYFSLPFSFVNLGCHLICHQRCENILIFVAHLICMHFNSFFLNINTAIPFSKYNFRVYSITCNFFSLYCLYLCIAYYQFTRSLIS